MVVTGKFELFTKMVGAYRRLYCLVEQYNLTRKRWTTRLIVWKGTLCRLYKESHVPRLQEYTYIVSFQDPQHSKCKYETCFSQLENQIFAIDAKIILRNHCNRSATLLINFLVFGLLVVF